MEQKQLDRIAAILTAGMLPPATGLERPDVLDRAAKQAVALYDAVRNALGEKFPAQD